MGVSEKTYVDDVFNTFLYKGNNSTNTLNTGLDMSGKGGLVWLKARGSDRQHILFDTARGANKKIATDSNTAQWDGTGTYNQTFTSTGFTVNNSLTDVNDTNIHYSSWNFRKAKGFFDVVTYTGNGSNRTIAHNLGCVPGCIIVKRLNTDRNWIVYHVSVGNQKYLNLNNDNDATTSSSRWNNTTPTSSVFSVGESSDVNGNGDEYVAYLFAGGSTVEGSSVALDGTGDYLSCGSSSDFSFGTGDFTIEGWFKKDDSTQGGFWQISSSSGGLGGGTAPACAWTGGAWQMYGGGDNTGDAVSLIANKWYHIAQVRHSGTTTMYVDGAPVITRSDTTDYTGTHLAIGGYYGTPYLHEGNVSNFRIVKGTAVYKSAFTPQYKQLENISGTVILCCNGSTTTSSTVTPTTITANGDPSMSVHHPDLIDPNAFKFGENGDQNIIKCGSYTGNGNGNAPPEIFVGFEPQWVLIKNSNASQSWRLLDSLRGVGTFLDDQVLTADSTAAEFGNTKVDFTSTGFIARNGVSDTNGDGNKMIYVAIRRPDGYTGKPAESGTDVFAIDTGSGAADIPTYDSGFPVDYSFQRKPGSSHNYWSYWRLTPYYYMNMDTNDNEALDGGGSIDSNLGYSEGTGRNSSYQAWMWKRHAGFDVVTWRGDGQSKRFIQHNLNKVPEMIWLKSRSDDVGWFIGHKAMNSGNSPFSNGYYMQIDTGAQTNDSTIWNENPTSSHFNVGNYSGVNGSNKNILAMLFASVDGISKVGSYTGNGSSTGPVITTGFSPRFVLIKSLSSGSYFVYDTTRGLASGNDQRLQLNSNSAQTAADDLDPSSTGFQLKSDWDQLNNNGTTYIYYAHA